VIGRSVVLGVVLALGVLLGALPSVAAADCGSPANAIVAENCRPGSPPSEWDTQGAGNSSLQGFATDISVNRGSTVHFKIDASVSSYRLDIYRMGYYGGDGARLVATVPATAQSQPACTTQASTGLIDCGNWAESASWAVPADAVSGIYFAHLVATDGSDSHIVFVVRDDASHSPLFFQTSDTTWQAYNTYGGNSLYVGGPGTNPDRAYKVSYNRPFTTRGTSPEDWVFNAEYPMVRWLERNGYDVSYTTGVDSDRNGGLIQNHGVFMSVGHDEYWSGGERANITAARDAGVNLAFFSGNEGFWKTRWEDNHRTLVSYKETHNDAHIDPSGIWTGSWRDPRPFNPEGPHPENALTGTIFMVNEGSVPLAVPAADGLLRLWRGTAVAGQPPGATAQLGDQIVGYEWDEDLDNGFRPAGLIDLSTTTATGVQVLQDYGHTYASGTATHHLTLYRDTNGAGPDSLVFGAGTVQWPWGLDSDHDRGSAPAEPAMQQATVNLFADMGVQPGSLQTGSPAAPSTDTVAPTSTIASVTGSDPVTVSGTAVDTGGGRVGGVEVSVDGGASWHPADGRESWSYTFTPASTGQPAILSRAVDDSGNLGPPPPETPSGGGVPPAGHAGAGGPKIKLTTRRIRVSRSGRVVLRVACPRSAGRCRGTLRLTAGRRKLTAKKSFTVAGGKSKRVTLKLTRSARRLLARKHTLRAVVVATVRDRSGHRATTRTSIRLLAPRRS
jgi:hypothetical protein